MGYIIYVPSAGFPLVQTSLVHSQERTMDDWDSYLKVLIDRTNILNNIKSSIILQHKTRVSYKDFAAFVWDQVEKLLQTNLTGTQIIQLESRSVQMT